MARPKRSVHKVAAESTTPPDTLTASQAVARIVRTEGNSMFLCQLPDKTELLLELAQRFRSTIWIRRGGYVLADITAADERAGALAGEIINVVREEKEWRKMPYWPKEFTKSSTTAHDSDDSEEESTVGKMPPSDSEDEREEE